MILHSGEKLNGTNYSEGTASEILVISVVLLAEIKLLADSVLQPWFCCNKYIRNYSDVMYNINNLVMSSFMRFFHSRY